MRPERPAIEGYWPLNPLKMHEIGIVGIARARCSEAPLTMRWKPARRWPRPRSALSPMKTLQPLSWTAPSNESAQK